MSLKNITPINREIVLKEDDLIVSKTDLKGKITYVNQVFTQISGFTERDVLGVQHNVVRHPDMPRAVFKTLWDHIQNGQEIFAFVKNMAKDGSFYWVMANVTASRDETGTVVGYYSVRRKPNPRVLPAVSALYQQMLDAERKAGARDAIAASTQLLTNVLSDKGMSYEQFVLSLQAA